MATHQKSWLGHLWFTFIQMSELKRRTLAVFWTGFTAFLSLMPPGDSSSLEFLKLPGVDKVGHCFFYFCLALFWCLAGLRVKGYAVIVFIFCVSFGILMEFLQFYLFYGRQFEILDMIANTIGVGCGIVLYKTKIS